MLCSEKRNMYLFLFVISSFALKLVVSDISCENHQLPCDNRYQCINREKWCDKNKDCEDNSDEKYCKFNSWFTSDPNDCEETHFLCKNGNCVPNVAKCDTHKDCKDGSDENDCNKLEEKDLQTTTETSEESSSSPESDSESESSGEIDDNEISIDKPETSKIRFESEISTERSVVSHEPSVTSFYQRRMKEMEKSSTQEASAATSPTIDESGTSVSPTSYSIPHRSRVPLITATDIPARTFYNHSRPVNRDNPSQTHLNYINRHPVYNKNQPSYIKRPSSYDRISSSYDNHQLTYDRHPSAYDRHPASYDRYPGRYPAGYGNRQSTYGRVSSPYTGRSSQISNREYEWRQEENLKPFKRQKEAINTFHFAKDFSKLYEQQNFRQLEKAKTWLLAQRNSSGTWGEDTPRALVALALTNGNFSKGIPENELMKRNFLVQLGINILRNDSKEFTLNRMSMALNALLAICENPRDFHGLDLTVLLQAKIRDYQDPRKKTVPYINPLIYLSLCLSGKPLGSSVVQTLMKQMHASPTASEVLKDTQSLAIQTFACYIHQNSHDSAYRRSLEELLQNAVSNLLQRMSSDGSFGSVYSTALAAQALLSVNDSRSWEAEKTLNFLKQQQHENGSFGDLLATYFTLPVLSGRSLLHLRNVQCETSQEVRTRDLTPPEILEFTGPRHYVHYSIYFDSPLTNSYSMRVLVPEGINLLDMMRVAEHQDRNFRFAYEQDDRNLHVYSVSGLPDDPEQGIAWHIYLKREFDSHQYVLKPAEQFSGDIRSYLPKSDDHVILWYHSKRH